MIMKEFCKVLLQCDGGGHGQHWKDVRDARMFIIYLLLFLGEKGFGNNVGE